MPSETITRIRAKLRVIQRRCVDRDGDRCGLRPAVSGHAGDRPRATREQAEALAEYLAIARRVRPELVAMIATAAPT